jgi:hypothetical protein
MSGFAKPFEILETVTKNYGGVDGYPQIENLGSQVFYGFTIDHRDGDRLRVTIIDGANGDAVLLPLTGGNLPVGGIKRYTDYTEWIWTSRDLTFSWGDENGDHLYMEVI